MFERVKLSNGDLINYTPSIFKDDREGYETIHLEGFDHGYTAYMMLVPEHKFSFVFFSNDQQFPIHEINSQLYDWFNTKYAITAPKIDFENLNYGTLDNKNLKKYIGNYFFEQDYFTRSIELNNDTLYYVRSKDNKNALLPLSGGKNFVMDYGGQRNFRISFQDEGERVEFRIINPGTNNDYNISARKINLETDNLDVHEIIGDYICEELDHKFHISVSGEDLYMKTNESTIKIKLLDRDEFIAEGPSVVKHIKIKRDLSGSVRGIYASGEKLKCIAYNKQNN